MFILRPVVISQGMSMNNILFLITAVTFQRYMLVFIWLLNALKQTLEARRREMDQ